MVRIVKREHGSGVPPENGGGVPAESDSRGGINSRGEVTERRFLRSRYLAVKNLIVDERDDISKVDSEKFQSIITEVENLHQQVQKPREQVADAEALLDIANTLMTSVKSQSSEGITPSDFITAILKNFGQEHGVDNTDDHVDWGNVGSAVSHVFKKVSGCCTMLGPMNTELKQHKAVTHRKRTRPSETARPEELQDTETGGRTDTDKNMSAMFEILRKKRTVRLENLVLNRVSFAQTIENLFALSFLVKDGRAEITVDNNGHHIVSPRNAPPASAVASGEVFYHHFVFRFDFKDWKLLMNAVVVGEELMPHRSGPSRCVSSQVVPVVSSDPQPPVPQTTPIRKLTRNRGLVIQEQSVLDDSPEKDASGNNNLPDRGKRKRLFRG